MDAGTGASSRGVGHHADVADPSLAPADLYLDLLARALTRDLFLDEEVRNVDLREWPGGEPEGLRDLLRERRWRVVRPGADPTASRGGALPVLSGVHSELRGDALTLTGHDVPPARWATTGRRTPRPWSASSASPTWPSPTEAAVRGRVGSGEGESLVEVEAEHAVGLGVPVATAPDRRSS